MTKHLLAVAVIFVVAMARAEANEACVTNELDDPLITADLALAIGNCHLDLASREGEGISALEYAYTWYLQAHKLGSSEARQRLKTVEQQLAKAETTHTLKPIN